MKLFSDTPKVAVLMSSFDSRELFVCVAVGDDLLGTAGLDHTAIFPDGFEGALQLAKWLARFSA